MVFLDELKDISDKGFSRFILDNIGVRLIIRQSIESKRLLWTAWSVGSTSVQHYDDDDDDWDDDDNNDDDDNDDDDDYDDADDNDDGDDDDDDDDDDSDDDD